MSTKTTLIIFAGFLVIIYLIMVWSCNKEDENPGIKPVLPPSEALLMDFSDFLNPDYTLPVRKTLETLLSDYTYRNWGHSFTTVSFWNIVATITLAVPT